MCMHGRISKHKSQDGETKHKFRNMHAININKNYWWEDRQNELGEKEEIRNSVSHRILHILMYSPTTKYT